MCVPAIAGAVGSAMSSIGTLSASTMMMASLGVSAVSTGVQYMAQHQQAQAQAEVARETQEASVESMIRSTGDLQQRELQERSATALRLQNARRQADEAKATANASSTNTGQTFDRLLGDYEQQYQSYADAQYQQLGFNVDQIGRQKEAIAAKAEGRINSIPKPQYPSALGAAARFGSQALKSYQTFSVRDPFTGKYTLT